MPRAVELFSVHQFFPDGTHECVRSHEAAVQAAQHYCHCVGEGRPVEAAFFHFGKPNRYVTPMPPENWSSEPFCTTGDRVTSPSSRS